MLDVAEADKAGVAQLAAFEETFKVDAELTAFEDVHDADCVVAAVAHREFAALGLEGLQRLFGEKDAKVLIDIKGMFDLNELKNSDILWWRL